jgi:hypothetical protein
MERDHQSALPHRLRWPGGPISTRDPSTPTYALLIDSDTAHAELAHQFDRKGLGQVSREEFSAALKADGIQGFNTRSPEAAKEKRKKDRRRQRINRAA